ncbi:MAG: hypothetical protein AAFP90_20610, partial [Planctomycetota bacterium]
FLMLARGNIRVILLGALLSIIAALLPAFYMAWHLGDGDTMAGLQTLREDIESSQKVHREDSIETPASSWTRVDALILVAKWNDSIPDDLTHLAVMAVLLAPICGVLIWCRQTGRDDGASVSGPVGTLVITASIVTLYHQSYDCLLLAAAATAILFANRNAWCSVPRYQRRIAFGLMLLPSVNLLSTQIVLNRIGIDATTFRFMTSINAITLVLLLLQLLWICCRYLPKITEPTDGPGTATKGTLKSV